jgi:hypothetical protein
MNEWLLLQEGYLHEDPRQQRGLFPTTFVQFED